MVDTRIGIIGTGNVGSALARGFSSTGHEVRMGSRNPQERSAPPGVSLVTPVEAVEWAEVVVLAVKYIVTKEVITEIGPERFAGKVLLDPTNALTKERELAIGFTTSASEEIQKTCPNARVVKAFNTVFARNQDKGKVAGEQLSLFVAGDYPDAKRAVMELGAAIGFDPVDCGPLRSARYLEPMAFQLIYLNDKMGLGTQIGYRLTRGPERDSPGITP